MSFRGAFPSCSVAPSSRRRDDFCGLFVLPSGARLPACRVLCGAISMWWCLRTQRMPKCESAACCCSRQLRSLSVPKCEADDSCCFLQLRSLSLPKCRNRRHFEAAPAAEEIPSNYECFWCMTCRPLGQPRSIELRRISPVMVSVAPKPTVCFIFSYLCPF